MRFSTSFLPPALVLAGFLAGGATPLPVAAQSLADSEYKWAAPVPGTSALDVNPEAWHSFTSLNAERTFGKFSEQDFTLGASYTNRYIFQGKKASGRSALPEFTWAGPLFGGEGYTTVGGVLPLQSPYAARLEVSGGWRYHLTTWVNVDLGGAAYLYNKSVFGQGLPAPYGTKVASPVYAGFEGRVLTKPAVYFTYDPTFGEAVESFSLSHVFDLGELAGIPGLRLGTRVAVSLLHADVYNGGSKAGGGNWRNGYAWFEAGAGLDYKIWKGLHVQVAGKWAVNNDGSGSTGIAGTNLGPSNNLSFSLGVLYQF